MFKLLVARFKLLVDRFKFLVARFKLLEKKILLVISVRLLKYFKIKKCVRNYEQNARDTSHNLKPPTRVILIKCS